MASISSGVNPATQIPQLRELRDLDRIPPDRPAPARSTASVEPAKPPLLIDRTLARVANLTRLLPAGTVLAFQSLSPSFTNHGKCFTSNKYLSALLIHLCVVSCVFFSFTDSLVGRDGKLYYGVATLRGFRVFNYDGPDEDRGAVLDDLGRLRMRWLDCVHAFFSALVFLTVAFSDAEIQSCFFPADLGADARELQVNLPLGAGVLSSIVFIVFPTYRKGIGYTDTTRR
ncbi:protein DMP2-like [Typha angustifolia]|uniref:protein DMP2-like n=1 Tax=Typha angustifolia TaxID=59011 RepID=UPI003C2C8E6E